MEATKRPKVGLMYHLFAEEAGLFVLKNLRGRLRESDDFEKSTLGGGFRLLH